MVAFKLSQWVDEPFHVYFSRFKSFVEYLESCGEYFHEFELENIVHMCMNDETRAWFNIFKGIQEFSIIPCGVYWSMFTTMARIDQYK